jgi:hypothetical protein
MIRRNEMAPYRIIESEGRTEITRMEKIAQAKSFVGEIELLLSQCDSPPLNEPAGTRGVGHRRRRA